MLELSATRLIGGNSALGARRGGQLPTNRGCDACLAARRLQRCQGAAARRRNLATHASAECKAAAAAPRASRTRAARARQRAVELPSAARGTHRRHTPSPWLVRGSGIDAAAGGRGDGRRRAGAWAGDQYCLRTASSREYLPTAALARWARHPHRPHTYPPSFYRSGGRCDFARHAATRRQRRRRRCQRRRRQCLLDVPARGSMLVLDQCAPSAQDVGHRQQHSTPPLGSTVCLAIASSVSALGRRAPRTDVRGLPRHAGCACSNGRARCAQGARARCGGGRGS